MEKKLYLFKPAARWKYCGGVVAIVAESFDECRTLFDEKLHPSEEDANKELENFYNWVLHEALPTYPDEESRVVLEDYNWA